MNRNSVLDDLDRMLSQQGNTEDEVQTGNSLGLNKISSFSCNDWPEIQLKGTSVNLVPMLIDDSGSIRWRRIIYELVDGSKFMIKELQSIAENEKETILMLTGFYGNYFFGNVLDMDVDDVIDSIRFTFNSTPLISTACDIAHDAERVEESLKIKGISVATNMLLITDGDPDEDNYSSFKSNVVFRNKHWRVSGMGITSSDERIIGEQRERFTNTFTSMGIKKIITPNTDDLRAALFQFSKSVSAI